MDIAKSPEFAKEAKLMCCPRPISAIFGNFGISGN
jgi:hypothetical protein